MSEASLPPLVIRLFGPLEARLDGEPIARLRTRKGQWLLALLALRHGREVERGWLAAMLWPDSPAEQAMANLRRSLTDLRHALGDEAARLSSPSLQTLRLDLTGADVDLLTFDAALARGDPASLEQVVALYRGPLLEGCAEMWAFQERQVREEACARALEVLADQARARNDFAVAERHLRRAVAVDPLRETAHRMLMQVRAAAGNYASALEAYRVLGARLYREINAKPDAETRALFQRLQAEARERARRTGRPLPRVGAVEPEIGAAGLQADTAGIAPRHNLPRPLTSFIGREKEIAEILRLLSEATGNRQPGAEETGEPASSCRPSGYSRSEGIICRLVTLTGAGGCGKSRLAQQVGRELLEAMPDGVWLVEMASLADPALVPQAVATALGIREQPSLPLAQTLVHFLRPKRLLLLLDNCEHLLDGCAALVETLLRACAGLSILATSREGLGIPGETIFRVPSLSTPEARGRGPGGDRSGGARVDRSAITASPSVVLQYEAVQLFVDRAVAAMPSFALLPENAVAVAQICQRLDGIPLAIELAAARAKALSVQTLAERLGDRFELLSGGSRTALRRHQTLRALVEWSDELLSEPERGVLRRLSVFAGGWTLEAAEAICGEGAGRSSEGGVEPQLDTFRPPPAARRTEPIAGLLANLVDKSLVEYEEPRIAGPAWVMGRETWVGEGRYRLLETVRQYARERLTEAGETGAVRSRHRDYFLALAERGAAEIWGPAQRSWFDRLEADHDNLRAALEWTHEQTEIEIGLRMAAAMGPFWTYAGYVTEGQQQLEKWIVLKGNETVGNGPVCDKDRAVTMAPPVLSPRASRGAADRNLAAALFWAGLITRSRGDPVRARAWLQEGLTIAKASGGRHTASTCLFFLGTLASTSGEWAAAHALHAEGLAIAREIDDPRLVSMIVCELGLGLLHRGDFEPARAHLTEALAMARACGNYGTAALASSRLGMLLGKRGDLEQWRSLAEQGVTLARESGNVRWLSLTLSDLGLACRNLGDLDAARCHLAEASALHQRSGDSQSALLTLIRQGHVHRDAGDYATAQDQYGLALQLAREMEQRLEQLWALEGLAAVAQWQRQSERAGVLFAAASMLRELLDMPQDSRWAMEFGPLLGAARDALGEAVFAAAWANGRALSLDEAVAYALEGHHASS